MTGKVPKDQGPVARNLVSANSWLRGIKSYRFPWYVTLVSANYASNNPGLYVTSRASTSVTSNFSLIPIRWLLIVDSEKGFFSL